MSGNTVRFEVLLDVMSKMEEGEQFIFSDVDLFIRDIDGLIKTINNFKNNDLVFMHDSEHNEHLNIGFGLIKNTTKMREIQDFITDIINVVLDDYKKKLK